MEQKSNAPDGAGQEGRLMIQKMVFQNFKSYGGRKVLGPFHKRFTAIVGPNGSGKSNVIDGLCFVFGHRASQLRLKKLADLIHSSGGHTADSCDVSIVFHRIIDTGDSADDYDVVPDSQFTITRRVLKSGTSRYLINGKESTQLDVFKHMQKSGVDVRNNRFLIIQGEVEQISCMPPKSKRELSRQGKSIRVGSQGLLEYLENIVGTDVYVEPIEAQLCKLEAVEQERQSTLARVRLVEKEASSLEGPKQEAMDYVEAEYALNQIRHKRAQLQHHSAQKQLAVSQQHLQELESKFASQAAQLKQLTGDLGSAEQQKEQQEAECAALREEQAAAKASFAAYERSQIKFMEELRGKVSKKKALKAGLQSLQAQAVTALAEQKAAQNRIPTLEARLEKQRATKGKADAKLDALFVELQGQTGSLRAAVEAKEKSLVPYRQQLNEAEQALGITKNQRDMLQSRLSEMTGARSEMARAIDQTQASLDKHQQQLKQCQQEHVTCTDNVQQAENELSEVRQQVTDKTQQAQGLRAQLDEAECQQEAHNAGSQLHQAVMKASASGKLRGVIGRLGDLGMIPKKYDVAVSTAAAGALNYIVVEDSTCAQQCLNFLRKNKLGRATFIVLKQVTGSLQKARKLMEQTPPPTEAATRLISHITLVEDRFWYAFYFAMRDTLVCGDMDEALLASHDGRSPRDRHSKGKRWRVVTLDGNVVDASGTVSGGGTKQRSGLMRVGGKSERKSQHKSAFGGASAELLSTKQINAIKVRYNALVAEISELKQRARKLESRIKSLRAQQHKLSMKAKKLQLQVDSTQQSLADLQNDAVDLKANDNAGDRAELQVQIEDLDDTMTQQQVAVEAAKKQCSTLESEVAELQKRILDAGGASLRLQQETVNSLAKLVAKTEKELTESKVAITAAGKKHAQSLEDASKDEEKLTTLKGEIDKLKAGYQEIEQESLELAQNMKKAQGLLASRTLAMKTVVSKCESLRSELAEVKKSAQKATHLLEDARGSVKEHTNAVKMWDKRSVDLAAAVKETGRVVRELTEGDSDAKSVENDEAAPATDDGGDEVPSMLDANQLEELALDSLHTAPLEAKLVDHKPNLQAITEWRVKKAEYLQKVAVLDEVSGRRDKVRKMYDGLRSKRLNEFMKGFTAISGYLKQMYQMITLGGDAELELVDSLDPFSEGINFSVRPPKKSWKSIQNLSGGEKTLSSLALVFALHSYKPNHLYVLDEIDAALDFKNVSIVGNYIKERAKDAQFIIISLRNNMFELADRLVGIYKTHDITKSVTIDPRKIANNSNKNNDNSKMSNNGSDVNSSVVSSPSVHDENAAPTRRSSRRRQAAV